MRKSFSNHTGFTLIELLMIITVIAILIAMVTIVASGVRTRTRDAKRISNVQEIKTALEEYYFDEHAYPAAITTGNPLIGPTSGKTYLAKIPANPTPRADGSCPNNDYTYTQDGSGTSYHLTFCLGTATNELAAGTNSAMPHGFCMPSCTGKSCGDDGCGGSCGSCTAGRECSSYTCVIDSYTKLLLHMDGSDNGTVFTDSSPIGRTITRSNAVTKTATKKFGTASGYFSGTGKLTMDDSADWYFPGDFTVDFWAYSTNANSKRVYGQSSTSAPLSSRSWELYLYDTSKNLTFLHVGSDDTTQIILTPTQAMPENQWVHLAVVRSGNTFKFYVNGTAVGEATSALALNDSPSKFAVGTLGEWTNSAQLFVGYIDEFRVSKGIARWTSNFTPPTEAY